MTTMAVPRTIHSTASAGSSSSTTSYPTSPPRKALISNGTRSSPTYVPLQDSSTKSSASSHSTHPTSSDAAPTTPNRPRINSRDIPRSYSGLYGQGDGDLLPFELARNWHTDWLENGGFLLLGTYIGGILLCQVVVAAVLENTTGTSKWSWTVTSALHCLLTTIYVHWMKGSLFDEQGEMAAMTLWEQLEGRHNTVLVKRTLTVVPCLLCWAACQFSEYEWNVCVWNALWWSICVVAKLPSMNGVRIFGINRTTGIDDYKQD